MSKMKRFGSESLETIDEKIKNNVPSNTVKTKNTIWKQFCNFCDEKKYVLNAEITDEQLADILKDWGFNMKKCNGEDYKENVVKTMWNQTAKMIQEKFYKEFGRVVDPFKSEVFKSARDARNAKRRVLQADPEKQTTSSAALEKKDLEAMVDVCDDTTPDGLQKKLFTIISVELAWRGGEGASATVHHFREEFGNDGTPTGRIEYNPIFTKTTQGGEKKLASSKWLIKNEEHPDRCPVKLLKELLSRRGERIKSSRLFLTVNPNWQNEHSVGWYKDSAIGKNTISGWNKETATKAGLDTIKKKITNHSSRATAVSALAKAGVSEQEIMKITGHSNANSIKPYLQLDHEHHENIVRKMRQDSP